MTPTKTRPSAREGKEYNAPQQTYANGPIYRGLSKGPGGYVRRKGGGVYYLPHALEEKNRPAVQVGELHWRRKKGRG